MLVGFTRSDGSLVCSAEIVASTEFSHNQPTMIELAASEAARLGEPRQQLLEGCSYEYQLVDPAYAIEEIPGVIRRSKMAGAAVDRGIITTSLYVGTLHFRLLSRTGLEAGHGSVEVRSRKIDYRTEYRDMLSEIAGWAADLVGSMSAISYGRFELEADADNKTLQQKYFLLRSILKSRDFEQAISKIKASPHTKLRPREIERDIRRGVRPTGKAQREVASRKQRVPLRLDHELRQGGIVSLPAKITFTDSEISFDTIENRFIKYFINETRQFILNIRHSFSVLMVENRSQHQQIIRDMDKLISDLDRINSDDPIRQCGRVTHLNLGSSVLQGRPGYREMLRFWTMIQMAAKLTWSGGEMVFDGARKNVATLYEYWCFVKLLGILGSLIDLPDDYKKNFIRKSGSGIELNLARGNETALVCHVNWRDVELTVELSFNRTFKANSARGDGSWTREMRPDMTLSVWPHEFDRERALLFNLISMVHFDAKYKSLLTSVIAEPSDDENDLTYSRDDLAKMHAYRDAIRRSEAAYILYPGNKFAGFSKFEEVLPGLGAIPMTPGDPSGSDYLRSVLEQIFDNCTNRSSKRAILAFGESKALSAPLGEAGFNNLPYVGPVSNGDLNQIDPQDRQVILLNISHDSDILCENGEYIDISVPFDIIDGNLISEGLRGRLIFTSVASAPGTLMRITGVSKIENQSEKTKLKLQCKLQPGPVHSQLLARLRRAAATQRDLLGTYNV